MALDVEMLTVGPIAENAFLVRPAGGDKLVVVDPGEEPERLLAAIEAMGAEVDAILQVVRCFEDEQVHHVEGSVNPRRDIETIQIEFAALMPRSCAM